ARPPRDHDQIAFLKPRRHAIEIGEAGRDAGHVRRVVAVVEKFDALHDLGQQRPDFLEALLSPSTVFSDLEYLGFGMVENLAYAAAERMIGAVGDVAARRGEPA